MIHGKSFTSTSTDHRSDPNRWSFIPFQPVSKHPVSSALNTKSWKKKLQRTDPQNHSRATGPCVSLPVVNQKSDNISCSSSSGWVPTGLDGFFQVRWVRPGLNGFHWVWMGSYRSGGVLQVWMGSTGSGGFLQVWMGDPPLTPMMGNCPLAFASFIYYSLSTRSTGPATRCCYVTWTLSESRPGSSQQQADTHAVGTSKSLI